MPFQLINSETTRQRATYRIDSGGRLYCSKCTPRHDVIQEDIITGPYLFDPFEDYTHENNCSGLVEIVACKIF